VIAAGIYCQLNKAEWVAIMIVSGMVFIAEMLNTAIEKSMDLISKEHHPEIEKIKDLAAGAVLIAALVAVVTGAIIFIPKSGLF
jgi:diacylglycerol kinase (ATP)